MVLSNILEITKYEILQSACDLPGDYNFFLED